LFKFLHVIGAILWVGGINTLTILYLQLSRVAERTALASLLQTSSVAGRIIVLNGLNLLILLSTVGAMIFKPTL